MPDPEDTADTAGTARGVAAPARVATPVAPGSDGGRTPLHTRTLRLDGYARPDGGVDVEARLTDVKHYDVDSGGRVLRAGDPMHDMHVTMSVDDDGTIIAFEARTLAGPHALCQVGAAGFGRLVGLSTGRGFLKAAAERVGGTQGCTHLREMLQQMATVAFQSQRESRVKRYADPDRRPPLIDTCAAWASSGEWVRVRFPQHYTGAAQPQPGAPQPDGGEPR
jgi:hypothetical protein